MATVDDKLVYLLEASRIKEVVYPLPGGHFAFGVLLINTLLATSQFRFGISSFQFFDLFRYIHVRVSKIWGIVANG